MLKYLLACSAAVLLFGGCASTPKSEEQSETMPSDPPKQAETAKPSAADEHKNAVAEVARLQAEAEKDPMTAPWTGPNGGVPPWDKVKSDLFPGAFTKGLALLKAEVAAVAANPEP